jgi:hypothetical protein
MSTREQNSKSDRNYPWLIWFKTRGIKIIDCDGEIELCIILICTILLRMQFEIKLSETNVGWNENLKNEFV